jgi:hypothetical protein
MRCFLSQEHLWSRDIASAICKEQDGADHSLLGVSSHIASNDAQTERKTYGIGGKDTNAGKLTIGVFVRKVADEAPAEDGDAEDADNNDAAGFAKSGCKVCGEQGEDYLAATLRHAEEEGLKFAFVETFDDERTELDSC